MLIHLDRRRMQLRKKGCRALELVSEVVGEIPQAPAWKVRSGREDQCAPTYLHGTPSLHRSPNRSE